MQTWTQPKLTVLVRGKPEESVLGGCKIKGTAGPGNKKTCARAGGCSIISTS